MTACNRTFKTTFQLVADRSQDMPVMLLVKMDQAPSRNEAARSRFPGSSLQLCREHINCKYLLAHVPQGFEQKPACGKPCEESTFPQGSSTPPMATEIVDYYRSW